MKQKQKQQKLTLAQTCEQRLKFLQTEKFEKDLAAKREQYREQEDELMAMTYGPNWRDTRAAWEEPETRHQAVEQSTTRMIDPETDDDDDDLEDFEISGELYEGRRHRRAS